jgi:Sulfotransferase family
MTSTPVFVLSTGRCGTLSLQRFLKRSSQVEAFHRYRGRRSRYRNDMSFVLEQNLFYYRAHLECNERLHRRIVGHLRRSRRSLINRLAKDGRGFIELNHEFTPYGNALVEAFPEAKFVHLHRNPREVITSFMRKFSPPLMSLPALMGTRHSLLGQYVLRYGYLLSMATWTPASCSRFIEEHRYDTQLHPFEKTDGKWRERNDWSAFEKTCWYWGSVNEIALQLMSRLPRERRLTLDFESLFSTDVASSTKRLLDFAGVTDLDGSEGVAFFHERINAKEVRDSFPSPHQWDRSMLETLERHCGRVMELLGYREAERAWVSNATL